MTIRIEWKKAPLQVDLEGSSLIRNWSPDLTASQVLAQTLQIGNLQGEFGDLFRVTGNYADQRSLWSGDFSLLTGLAACQREGQTVVEGNVGHRAGASMRGGSLIIRGNGANDLGSSMTGGTIFVTGNTGDRTGGSGSGEISGMNRGTIIVAGNCGEAVGMRMRRGTIWVGGSAQGYAGFQLIAGTVIIGQSDGIGLAHDMKRGTVLALRTNANDISAIRFRTSGTVQGGILSLLCSEFRRCLQAIGETSPQSLELYLTALQQPLLRFTGDRLQNGSGELLISI